jgi:hypothetical protein
MFTGSKVVLRWRAQVTCTMCSNCELQQWRCWVNNTRRALAACLVNALQLLILSTQLRTIPRTGDYFLSCDAHEPAREPARTYALCVHSGDCAASRGGAVLVFSVAILCVSPRCDWVFLRILVLLSWSAEPLEVRNTLQESPAVTLPLLSLLRGRGNSPPSGCCEPTKPPRASQGREHNQTC